MRPDEDEEDANTHAIFGSFREHVVELTHDLSRAVMDRIGSMNTERTGISTLVSSMLVETTNILTGLLGINEKEEQPEAEE